MYDLWGNMFQGFRSFFHTLSTILCKVPNNKATRSPEISQPTGSEPNYPTGSEPNTTIFVYIYCIYSPTVPIYYCFSKQNKFYSQNLFCLEMLEIHVSWNFGMKLPQEFIFSTANLFLNVGNSIKREENMKYWKTNSEHLIFFKYLKKN